MSNLDLNNRIKEMVISYSCNDNIKFHPEGAINDVKQLIREVLDEITPARHPGTSEFADGANMMLTEITLRRRKLGVDLSVASGQNLEIKEGTKL